IRQISAELPALDQSGIIVMNMVPDYISMKFPPTSNIPVAAICLRDTLNALIQVRIGLNECLKHKVWYREKCDPPDEHHVVLYTRFYVDAIVAQLYAAGEHLASAIICMLELTEDQLENYRENRVSQQSIVGHYLANEQAGASITMAVSALATSKEWKKTMAYRGRWTHEQPPTVSGLVPVYTRRRRWEKSEDGTSFALGLGHGDDAEFSIDDILEFVQPAVFQFVELFEIVVPIYRDVIGKKGIVVTDTGIEVNDILDLKGKPT
ncbi:MAG TPA: hypothetical protein VGA72_08905, partial [Anaerolineales bacterium]